jgi:hypothetical protein
VALGHRGLGDNMTKTTQVRREAAADRIIRGESTVVAEARKLRVSPRAIAQFVTYRKKGTRPGRHPPPDRTVEADHQDPSGALARALASAGIGDSSDDDPTRGGSDEDGEPIPAPSPDQVLAIAETIRSQMLRLYAGVVGLDPTDARVLAVLSLSEAERSTWAIWAPYVVKALPALLAHADEWGGYALGGCLVLSTWNGLRTLRAMQRREMAVPTVDPNTGRSAFGSVYTGERGSKVSGEDA